MKYHHVLSYVSRTLWAMDESKLDDLVSVLAFRAAGHAFTAEEIRARIGDPQPAKASTNGAVAIVPLRGVIAHRMGAMDESSGGMSAERFTGMIRQAAADASIGTIVIDCDSGGGTIAGLIEAADAVFEARAQKRVVAVANAWMASAAYWICSQAHEVVAIPSALDRCIGSLGVFMVHLDLSEKLAKDGVKATIIRAGEHKAEGNPFEAPSDEFLADLKANAVAVKAVFVKQVARARGLTPAQVVAQYGDGRAFSAPEAKKVGLIDRIATMDETIGRLVGKRSGGALQAEEMAVDLAASDDRTAETVLALDDDARARRRRLL